LKWCILNLVAIEELITHIAKLPVYSQIGTLHLKGYLFAFKMIAGSQVVGNCKTIGSREQES
jgi:hypothetical protein